MSPGQGVFKRREELTTGSIWRVVNVPWEDAAVSIVGIAGLQTRVTARDPSPAHNGIDKNGVTFNPT